MVAWRSSTLSFTNDTENYLLIIVSYDGTNLEVGIWGTDEGRTVKSSYSDWGVGSGGYSLTNYRTVYTADGSVLHQDSFSSYYLSIEQEEVEEEQTEETGSS